MPRGTAAKERVPEPSQSPCTGSSPIQPPPLTQYRIRSPSLQCRHFQFPRGYAGKGRHSSLLLLLPTADWHEPDGNGNTGTGPMRVRRTSRLTRRQGQAASAVAAHQLRTHRYDLGSTRESDHQGARHGTGGLRSKLQPDCMSADVASTMRAITIFFFLAGDTSLASASSKRIWETPVQTGHGGFKKDDLQLERQRCSIWQCASPVGGNIAELDPQRD